MWLKELFCPSIRREIWANYRGITLMAVEATIYSRVLLDRLRPHIDPKLRNNQHGFRKGRSTVAQIHTLRKVVEGIKSKTLLAIITFSLFPRGV